MYELTAQRSVLGKLNVDQLGETFFAFYGTWRFIAVFLQHCYPELDESSPHLRRPVFGSFRISREKRVLALCSSVCTCVNLAPTGRIFVKFDIGDLYQNLSIKSKFGYSRTKVSGTLRKGLSTFYRCRHHKLAIKLLSSSKTVLGC